VVALHLALQSRLGLRPCGHSGPNILLFVSDRTRRILLISDSRRPRCHRGPTPWMSLNSMGVPLRLGPVCPTQRRCTAPTAARGSVCLSVWCKLPSCKEGCCPSARMLPFNRTDCHCYEDRRVLHSAGPSCRAAKEGAAKDAVACQGLEPLRMRASFTGPSCLWS
jgi:hypothetical protein